MTHDEFVRNYNDRKIIINVNRKLALKVMETSLVPSKYRIMHIVWSWIWILSVPIGIVCMFIFKWWIGLLIILFLTPAISSGTKKTAFQNIIMLALDIPEFYNLAVNKGLLIIEEKT